MKSLSLVMA